MPFARQDNGTARSITIPKKGLPIKRIARTINERWPQRDNREPGALVNSEQRTLAHGFVARIRIGVVIRRQGVAFMVVQPIAVSRNARHENIAANRSVEEPGNGFHLAATRAVLPIVREIVNGIEASGAHRLTDGGCIVPIGDQVPNTFAEGMLGTTVQNVDFVPRPEQLRHEKTADELSATDHENSPVDRLFAVARSASFASGALPIGPGH